MDHIDLILEEMGRQKITGLELSKHLDINKQTWYGYKNRHRDMPLETFLEIAKFLGVSPCYLLGDDASPDKERIAKLQAQIKSLKEQLEDKKQIINYKNQIIESLESK